jgi:hypothetical protein
MGGSGFDKGQPKPWRARGSASFAYKEPVSAERSAAVEAQARADDAVFEAAKQVLVEEADRIEAEMVVALGHAFALHDDLHALAMLSAQGRGQTWQEGQVRLSPPVHRRLTTPLDWTFPGQRLPGWQAFFTALQADADGQR